MAGREPARTRASNQRDENWLSRSPVGLAAELARIGRQASQSAKRTYPHADLDKPLSDGSTIRQNMQTVDGWFDTPSYAPEMAEGALPYAFGRWLASVMKKGQWGSKLGEPNVQFNYGATGRRLGIPLEILQRAAGLVEQLEPITGYTGGSSPRNRVDFAPLAPLFGKWPYGDTTGGSLNIGGGYEAAKPQGKGRR